MEASFGFKVEITKKGLPAIWEMGGGYTNTGESRIVCNNDGSKKRAIYQKRSGHLANDKHALFPVECGDYIIHAFHHRKDFTIRLYRIVAFSSSEREEKYAITEKVHEFSRGEWDSEPAAFLKDAIEACKDKSTCYHCRGSHFVLE